MFPNEGYFYVKSQSNGLFISVDGEDKAGSKLVTGQKGDDDSQLWSYENGYLISKQTALVMDIEGGDLKSDKRVLQFGRKKTMSHNQRWGIRDGYVYAVADPRLVLDTKEQKGSYITVAVKRTEDNDLQQWYLEP